MKLLRVLAGSALFFMAVTSQAHFVWAEFRAAAHREVVVYFAEGPNDSVLDTIMPKINDRLSIVAKTAPKANTKIPTETTYPWEGTKGLFLGSVDYGVVDHGQGPYFLKYWFKAVSRPSQTEAVIGKGLELVAKQRADRWEVSVYNNGKPCPDAEVVWLDGETEKKASAKTLVSIPIPATPKALPIRATFATKVSGKFQDKSYTLQKEWSTLVLPEVGRAPEGAEESAYLALQNASQSRGAISKGFAFSCSFQASDGKSNGTGTVSVDAAGKVVVEVKGLSDGGAKHVQSQVQSLFFHRMGQPFWKGEGKNPLTWSKDDKNLLSVNDKMASYYRMNKTGFSMVQRTFGPKILVLDIKSVAETPWGGILSKEFTSTEKQASDNKVTSKLVYKDDFVRFLDEWMPKSRTVTGEAEGHKVTMTVTFSDYKLLP